MRSPSSTRSRDPRRAGRDSAGSRGRRRDRRVIPRRARSAREGARLEGGARWQRHHRDLSLRTIRSAEGQGPRPRVFHLASIPRPAKEGRGTPGLRGEESRTARAPAKALIAAHHASGGAHGSTIPMTRAPPRSSPVSCVIQPRGGTPRLPRFGSRRLFRAGSIGGSASPRAPQASTSMRRAASKLRARAARITSESAQ